MAAMSSHDIDGDDEEPNPFLAPPPPALTSAVPPPPLPPRVVDSGVGARSSERRSESVRAERNSSRNTSGATPAVGVPVQQQSASSASVQAPARRASRSPPVRQPPGSRDEGAGRSLTERTGSRASTTPTAGGSSNASGGSSEARATSRRRSGRSGGGYSNGTGAAAASPPPVAVSSTSPTTLAPPFTTSNASASSPPGSSRGSWSWGSIGRTLVGAVLGNGTSTGGSDTAAVSRRINEQHVRELTPHVMQQTPDGKFSVSVWRKNKQDTNAVQVSVGVYDTAYEGQRAAEAFAPPKRQEPAKDSRCSVCNSTFGFITKRRHHCRNCGRLVCSACAEAFWPKNMLPPTYHVDMTEKKVRVCSTCYGASEQFRRALLSGSEEDAMAAYSTGCVNLRTPYTIYHNELPVHCAAAGGNVNILAWLVEDRCCPLFLDRAKKVALGDSRRLSVMGAAAASGHVRIMRYLTFTQGCKVTEIRDMNTLWNALEKCLQEGVDVQTVAESHQSRYHAGGPSAAGSSGGRVGGAYPGSANGHSSGGSAGAEVAAAVADDDQACIVCFENKVDCTLVPCGHHCCCLTCAAQFDQCPVCRADVTQKIRAISV